VRHVKFGEGDYDVTEKLIRQLLTDANSGAQLPPAVDSPDTTPKSKLTPETYFSVGKKVNYGGQGVYDQGTASFDFPPALADDSFALRGLWKLDYQGATAQSDADTIALNYHAQDVYMVVGGTGTVDVTRDGVTTAIPVSGPPNMRQIVSADDDGSGHVEVSLSKGLQVFSFTYG
jgi:hypothetical protein